MVLRIYTEEQLVNKYKKYFPDFINKNIDNLMAILKHNGIKVEQFHNRYIITESE